MKRHEIREKFYKIINTFSLESGASALQSCRTWEEKEKFIEKHKAKKGLPKDENKDQTDIEKTHFELCDTLHKNMDNIPESVKEAIWDLVYAHYVP